MFFADCVRIRERRKAEGIHPATSLSMRARMKAQQRHQHGDTSFFVCLFVSRVVYVALDFVFHPYSKSCDFICKNSIV